MNDLHEIQSSWGLEFRGGRVCQIHLKRDGDKFIAGSFSQADTTEQLDTPRVEQPLGACVEDDIVLYRTIVLPQADPVELEKMIFGQLDAIVPTQGDQFATGWVTQADPKDNKSIHVLMYATRHDAIAPMVASARRVATRIVSVVPAMQALACLWFRFTENPDESVLLVNLGDDGMTLAVVRGENVLQCGVIDRPVPAVDGSSQPDELPTWWLREIRELFEYCTVNLSGEDCPVRVVVCGGLGEWGDIISQLASISGLPTEPAQAPKNLLLECEEDYPVVASVIAAALQGLEPTSPTCSLVETEKETKKTSKRTRWKWAISAIWLLAVITTLYYMDIHQAGKLSQTLRAAQGSVGEQGGLARALATGRYFEADGPSILDVLDRISEACPKSTLLSTFVYQRDGDLAFSGKVDNEKQCQAMLQALSQLGRVELKRGRPDKKKFRFEISLTLPRGVCRVLAPAKTTKAKPTTSPPSKPTKENAPPVPKKAPDSQVKIPSTPAARVPAVPTTNPSTNKPKGGLQ